MINWSRGTNRPLSKYFNSKEFTCKCGVCRNQTVDEALLKKLDEVREIYGAPVFVTSAFRCARHQAHLRGSLPKGHTTVGRSSHEDGLAADITAEDVARLYKICVKVFDNIGKANSFVHVDVRPKKPDGSKRLWDYA
jgi:zinc D-Ala-D-Ala carboxypeptidase